MGNCGSKRYSKEEVDQIIKESIALGPILVLKAQQLNPNFTLPPTITSTSGAPPSTGPSTPESGGV